MSDPTTANSANSGPSDSSSEFARRAEMKSRGVVCGPIHQQPWGALTHIALPSGAKLGIYQPRHARPEPMK